MEQTSNACVAELYMECGEQDKTCDTSLGKRKPPTQEDLDQLGQNNHNNNNTTIVDIQKEMGSPTPAVKEDVGDQDREQTPKIQEDIAELCLPEDDNLYLGDDSIPELLPLCDDQEKMEQDTENQVAEYPRVYTAGLDQAHVGDALEGEQDKTKMLPIDPVDCENHGDTPPADIPTNNDNTNTKADIGQEEMESDDPSGKEDLGQEQTPNIPEKIAELCLPQDDSIPEEQDTENHDVVHPREQEMACDDHSMEGERPTQVQIGNHDDFSISGPNNTKETAGATPKEEGAGDEDLEVLGQPPKMIEDIAELCLPQEDNPSLQDYIEEEEKLSLPTSLSSQEDGVMPRPPPDDEGGNMSTKHLIEMGVVCRPKEIRNGEEEEEVSQPLSLSFKSQVIVSCNDQSQQTRERSLNKVKNFDIKKPYGRQCRRSKNENLNQCKECEFFKTEIDTLKNKYSKLLTAHHRQCVRSLNYHYRYDQEHQYMTNEITDLQREVTSHNTEIDSLKNKNSKLLKAHRKQCLRFMNNNAKYDEERQCMKNAIADLQREVKSLKAARNMPPSDGLDGDEAKVSPVEE